jgi:hypothetical protein
MPVDNARNTFETRKGERIRFCLSSGKKDCAMFNIGPDHLRAGSLFLAHDGWEHGWLVPTSEISRYLSGDRSDNLEVKKSWTPRVRWSEDDGDVLWTNKETLSTFSLTPHRHPARQAQAAPH